MLRWLFTPIMILVFSTLGFTQIPEGYYSNAAGKSKAELKKALNAIIKNGHKPKTYDDLWDLLPESDEDPSNKNNFILIYTGRSIPKTHKYPNWNREHVWAKSHGGFEETPPAGTDAHHLRPADVSVNADRGNKDFDEGGIRHSEATGCFYTSTTWEPRDAVKGDIARMMFYMAVRYEGNDGVADLELVDYTNTSGPVFGKLSTLLKWHEKDPVDNFERHRNDVVYNYQGNRNPFIDHPEYVCLIWGNNCSTSTNVEINEANNYNITSNPVQDELNVVLPTVQSGIYIIYSIDGKLLAKNNFENSNEVKVNTKGFSSGYYFISVLSNSQIKIIPFVKD